MDKYNKINPEAQNCERRFIEKSDRLAVSGDLPLFVDLDGTLLKTDTLLESALILIKKQPWRVFSFISWSLKGKANLKQQIAFQVNLNVELLPFNEEFLSFLKKRKKDGQKIILATAANEKFANLIADYLGIFSDVLASNKSTNLKAEKKLNLIIQKNGKKDFIYAGNAIEDLPIWSKATEVIVVNTRPGIIRKITNTGKVPIVFSDSKKIYKNFLRSIRIHQWAKNLLVFGPLITSHKFTDLNLITNSIVACLSFCFCASSVYLLNDILDLENDRCHPSKRFRPFAAGDLSLKAGIFWIPIILCISLLSAYLLNPNLFALLVFYFFLTLIYSFLLKKVPLIDVITLSFLYTLRIFYGGTAISVVISQWLLSFSIFLFISLAFMKRATELSHSIEREEDSKGRGYLPKDLELLNIFGIASGYLSVIVFALYVDSSNVKILYRNPQMLWIICVFLFYWLSRMWLKVYRGEMLDDPVLFAIKDKTSYILLFLIAASMIIST